MASITQSRYAPDDLLAIDDRPMPELVDGQLREREVGQKSDAIAATVLAILWLFVRENGLGLVNESRGGYQIFRDDPTKVRIPDVSFTRRDRLAPSDPAEGHSRVTPDLVVEVTSPQDPFTAVQAKVDDYLAAGVALIWVVDPDARAVQVYRRDHTGVRLFPGNFLDGEDVVPGFRCEVAALFR